MRRSSVHTLAVSLCLSLVAPSLAWAQDAGSSSDAGVEPPAPRPPLQALQIRLRRLEAVQSAASTSLSLDVPLQSLFTVDLTDEAAIKDRLVLIKERLQRLNEDYPRLGEVPTSSTSTRAAALPLAIREAALEKQTLERERDFLELAPEARLSRLQADEARRIHEREQEQAEARAEQAARSAKAAEKQRLQALAEAEKAKTEALKALKSTLASVARAKTELAARQQALAEKQQVSSKEAAEALKAVQGLLEREQQLKDPAAALVLFGELNTELKTSTQVLSKSLGSLSQQLLVDQVPIGDLSRARNGSPEERSAAEELIAADQAFKNAVKLYREQLRSFRLQSVEAAFKRASALADARTRVLAKIPAADRAELRGLSWQGLEAIRLETEFIALGARAQPIIHADKVNQVPNYLKDIVTLGKTSLAAAKIVFIIFFAFWLRRQLNYLIPWLEQNLKEHVRSVVWYRRWNFFQRNIQTFGGYLIFIAALEAIIFVLGPLAETIEIDLLFTTALWFAYYHLLRTWLSTLILFLARRRKIRLSHELRTKLERSTKLIGRAFLFYGLLQSVAVKILRQGVLHYFAKILLLAGVLLLFLLLILSWRDTIQKAYLNRWPDGALARRIEASNDRFYHLPLTFIALGYVIGRGFFVFFSEFILGFDHTRRALAFLFRMRLERKSEQMGTWQTDISKLPDSLLEAFSLAPLTSSRKRLNYFPGIDKFDRDLKAFKAGKQKGMFLVRGSRGYGKTTWLHYALSGTAGLPKNYLSLRRIDAQPAAIYCQLAAFLDLPVTAQPEQIEAALLAGPSQVIALDDLHHLFFRQMEGTQAFQALMQLLERTGHHIFWLCSLDSLAWRHLLAACPMRIRFRSEQVLSDWPEEKLRSLLMLRAALSGVAHEFEDLVVSNETESKEEALLQASEGYTRLVWDYADGCPLVALRFWLHSLVPVDEGRVRVRLFKEPENARLYRIPEEGIFIYSAVANHGALTPKQAATISGYSETICEAALIRGVEEGYLELYPDEVKYTLAIDWQRQMIRFLRAKQAL